MELRHLKGSRVLPLGIAIAFVKLNGMVIVSGDFITILVTWCHAVRPKHGLVGHVDRLLVTSGDPLKALPSIKIE